MSDEKRVEEAKRWLETAINDYDAAIILKEHKKYSLSCFHAQQAAEKAIKALCYLMGDEPWGHSIRKLLLQLIEKHHKHKKALSLLDAGAMRLDQFYIPTRYPDGIPDLSPENAYGLEDAKSGIRYAQAFLTTVKSVFDVLQKHGYRF
jgi:HEPN domain-containing protein